MFGSKEVKRGHYVQEKLPFGEQILLHTIPFLEKNNTTTILISRQEFLRQLEKHINS